MIQEIKYNGFSATPSDYDSLDGDLAAVAGFIPEEGSLKPIAQPKALFTLSSGYSVVLQHKTSSFTHYIIQNSSNVLYWRDLDDTSLHRIHSLSGVEVYQITSIGNTLVALCSDGIHYMLWKADDGDYIYLGNKIPECPISFGLKGKTALLSELENEDIFTITYDDVDTDKKNIASQVLAQVNKFIAKVSTDDGKFIYPFFVRYAYRLYDQSLIHHSAPILMIPSTDANPIVFAPSGDIGSSSSTLDIFAVPATLDYQPLISSSQLSTLREWGDIVKSVDVFISAPIYTYDQSGNECDLRVVNPLAAYFHGRFIPNGGGVNDELISSTYQRWDYNQLYKYNYGVDTNMQRGFNIPSFSTTEINTKVKDCASFYFLTSININELTTERADVKIEEGSLGSIVAREVMTDDYQTHDTLVPTFSQVYNNRLNIANVERLLFKGYDTAAQVAYCSGYVDYYEDTPVANAVIGGNADILLYTKVQLDKSFTLCNTCSTPLSIAPWNYPYLYYPDASAKSVTLMADGSNKVTLTMEAHSFLNGSVHFGGLHQYFITKSGTAPTVDANPKENLPNKIYTSEVNNPFFFPVLGINTIGAGEIVGISTAAKALSAGQFGQFPLYAFTTEGVWALEVSATGAYSARQPITRDVCLSPHSITQIDSAVLFATERGVMLLSGSESMCITDILDSEEPFKVLDLPQGETLISLANISAEAVDYIPFKEFVTGCRMLYDYVKQRIYVFHPEHRYAYVYSLESKAWGVVSSDLASAINSYPEALAMDRYNRLVDVSTPATTASVPGFFITRPLKMGYSDILKSVNTIIQRGRFRRGAVKVALYGSRDLINWFLVYSSKDHFLRGFSGTPYKYFRVAVVSSLNLDESISGCTVQFNEKQTNQPR